MKFIFIGVEHNPRNIARVIGRNRGAEHDLTRNETFNSTSYVACLGYSWIAMHSMMPFDTLCHQNV